MPSVVLVEDDDDIRVLFAEELADRGFRVRTAADGRQGLAVIEAEPPDVIVSDLAMPEMDGAELRRRLLASGPRLAAIPFVVVSAEVEAEGAGPVELPVDLWAPKPIDLDALSQSLVDLVAAA